MSDYNVQVKTLDIDGLDDWKEITYLERNVDGKILKHSFHIPYEENDRLVYTTLLPILKDLEISGSDFGLTLD